MINVRSKYPVRVKFVKHRQVNDQPITSFSIGDKIKGDPNKGYQNYTFTVWDYVDLQDDDNVYITQIDSIQANYYKGKVYLNISGKVEVQEKEEFAEDAPPEFDNPEPTAEPKQAAEGVPKFADDEESLPFDL